MIAGITLKFVLWCTFFGMGGQVLRSVIGLYKLYMDENRDTKAEFDKKKLLISLALGAVIGGLTCLVFNDPLTKTDVMSIIAFGYAGVDGVEGFLNRRSSTIK
ncbi:MAG: hypothetical protein KA467_00915 [Bacteroidales bacterium]|nr:hypothetical protein [Bacteroidales bacterium]